MEEYKDVPSWVFLDEMNKLDFLHQIEVFDQNERDVFIAVTEYAEKSGTAYIPFPDIYNYIKEYGKRIQNTTLKFEPTITSILKKIVVVLVKNGYSKAVRKDNQLAGIILINPNLVSGDQIRDIINGIKAEYEEMERDETKPFPSGEGSMIAGLPGNIMSHINIRDLTVDKAKDLAQKASIVKITLPGTGVIYVPADKIEGLFDKSFSIIRRFFSKSDDFSSMILMKIRQQFPNIHGFNSSDDMARFSERSPQFFAALGNEILKNLQLEGKNRSIAQASEVIKALSIIQSDQETKKVLIESVMEILLKTMETYAVIFNKKQLFSIRDKNQTILAFSESEYLELIDQFIQRYSTPQTDGSSIILPITIRAEVCYLHNKHFYSSFITRIDSIAYQIKQGLVNRINADPEIFMGEPFMKNRELFNKFIEENYPIHDEIVSEILKNPGILYSQLVFRSTHDIKTASQIKRFFNTEDGNNPALKPLAEVLKLDYLVFFEDAKLKAPFKINPSIFAVVFEWLGKMIKQIGKNPIKTSLKKIKKDPENKSGSSVQEEDLGIIIKNMKEFKNSLVGDRDLFEMMNYYENRWNLALDKEDRKQNLEIVREKVSKRIRYIRFPSGESIQKEAGDMASADEILKAVKDRESLTKYIVLYMTAYFLNLEK